MAHRHPAVVPGLIFLALALWNLPRPGPYYDEVIDVVDSINLSGRSGPCGLKSWFGDSLEWEGGRLPLMRLVYTGPIKTWLFTAVFAVFPPGVLALRPVSRARSWGRNSGTDPRFSSSTSRRRIPAPRGENFFRRS